MLALQEGQTASIYLNHILSTKYKFTFLKLYEIQEHKNALYLKYFTDT